MSYGKRIDTLCSLLEKTHTFADIGCDHGYCTLYMLENGLCRRAIFSDISKGSLQKAQTLLARFVDEGRAIGVLGDGFYGVPKSVGEVLIAGMGGGEMISILSHPRYGFMPEKFVLQPMHDSEKLRKYLLENGGYITRDFTFEDGKYYDVIVGRKRGENEERQSYTPLETEFGRENLALKPKAFIDRTKKLLNDIEKYLLTENLQQSSREELLKRKERLEGVLSL
ncbi:MAG: SAM-dependent methyltransferase [Clostridia bacterium]|nr:SAM-dependent methyltransferase [Clostridia bacterium]